MIIIAGLECSSSDNCLADCLLIRSINHNSYKKNNSMSCHILDCGAILCFRDFRMGKTVRSSRIQTNYLLAGARIFRYKKYLLKRKFFIGPKRAVLIFSKQKTTFINQ